MALTVGFLAMAASPALAQDGISPLSLDVELSAGRSVVPPDIIENDIDQERLEGVFAGSVIAGYRKGDTRLFARAGAEVFPTENLLNRYAIGVGGSQDVPIAKKGRIRLRLGAAYDHVEGDEGRVFDRVRGDAQLITRHGSGHTTVARARYGYRDQSEARFVGFDQNEWLGELRHTFRPAGSDSSISVTALVLDVDAQDDRFSFRGLGFRVIGRTAVTNDLDGFARVSYINRDFEDPFSNALPISRDDNVWRVSAGLERPLAGNLIGFAEVGYIDHASNIAARDFSGAVAQIGVRIKLR